nr:putative transposase, Ptta/En/Spm, plant [Tanacetum cinerariifolium]
MGKRKRQHTICVSKVQQRPTEVEHSSKKNLSAFHPGEASSSRVSHQQHQSVRIHATTSSEATTDCAQSGSGLQKKVREFRELVTRWFDEKTQVESETKKLIRSKSNEPHVTGTKSFARITHDEI